MTATNSATSNSPLETLIQLEVLKALKTLSPVEIPPPSTAPAPAPPSAPPSAPKDHDHSEHLNLKLINDKLDCILDNERFLYERIKFFENTLNEILSVTL